MNMKLNSKHIIIVALFSLGFSFFVPPTASAAVLDRNCLGLTVFIEHWDKQDSQKSFLREQSERRKDAGFSELEEALANAPEEQKRALVVFRSALESAAAQRRNNVDVATTKFRAGVRNALQAGLACMGSGNERPPELIRLSSEYQTSVRAATVEFRAAVLAARSDFKSALAR